MNRRFAATAAATLLAGAEIVAGYQDRGNERNPAGPAYPTARAVEQSDAYHGTTIRDPYRWMEDLESGETKTWVKAQDDLSVDYLRRLPAYETFRSRILSLTELESVSTPRLAGGQLIYTAEGDPSWPKEQCTVYGAGFVAEVTNFQKLLVHRGRKSNTRSYSGKGHAEQMGAWTAFLRGDAEHPAPYAQARQSMLLTFAMLEAIQAGASVTL